MRTGWKIDLTRIKFMSLWPASAATGTVGASFYYLFSCHIKYIRVLYTLKVVIVVIPADDRSLEKTHIQFPRFHYSACISFREDTVITYCHVVQKESVRNNIESFSLLQSYDCNNENLITLWKYVFISLRLLIQGHDGWDGWSFRNKIWCFWLLSYAILLHSQIPEAILARFSISFDHCANANAFEGSTNVRGRYSRSVLLTSRMIAIFVTYSIPSPSLVSRNKISSDYLRPECMLNVVQ